MKELVTLTRKDNKNNELLQSIYHGVTSNYSIYIVPRKSPFYGKGPLLLDVTLTYDDEPSKE